MRWLKRLLCKHDFEFVRNIYGDEINHAGGRRSWWRCRKCGKWIARDELMRSDTRATIDALRARYGKDKTKLTDDQIAEGIEHYRPKAKVDIVVVDELRGDAE